MANFSKYKAYGVGGLLKHNNRTKDDFVNGHLVVHSNEDIDNSRTDRNYFFKRGSPADVKKRTDEVFCMKRKDMTVLGEMVVTLPDNVMPDSEDEKKFFKACYDFFRQDLGRENIINAVVHKDETTPHIHIDFVPVVMDTIDFDNKYNKRGRKMLEQWLEDHPDRASENEFEKLCCYEKITKDYLDTMHPRLSDYVEEVLGYKANILNGATIDGNKKVAQLKSKTMVEVAQAKVEEIEKEIKEKEEQLIKIGNDLNAIFDIGRKNGIGRFDRGVKPLMERISDLENQNTILKEIIAKNHYTYSKDELDTLRDRKYTPAESAAVNIFEGSLVNAEIEKNGIIVVELFDQVQRKSPQQKLIDTDDDLYRQAKLVQGSNVKVMWRNSRTSDRQYLFIKTDSEKQTMENLLLMEQKLREVDFTNRKVYMDKMETDAYDLAKTIFEKHNITVQYYISVQGSEKTDDKEKTQQVEK